jgi:hypothetical protein
VANWDEDSSRLAWNLVELLTELASAASDKTKPPLPTLVDAKAWQRRAMMGLDVPDEAHVGAFRGEPGLEDVNVRIGSALGVMAPRVAAELAEFEARLHEVLSVLDEQYPTHDDLDEDGLKAVIDVAGWAHAQWVRIHPFANGNGRTARIWANVILMRYGIEPVVRLRPRPDGGYGAAGIQAMHGDWEPTAKYVRALVVQAYQLRGPAGKLH